MNKKILALALVIVLIATVFTACKSGPETTEIEGVDLALATDANGETIINEDNQIAVYVTDSDNQIITHSNGEPQTHWEQLSDAVVIGDYLQTQTHKFLVLKGWEGDTAGVLTKKDTNGNCTIKFAERASLSEYGDLETFMAGQDEQNDLVVQAVKAEGYEATSEKGTCVVSAEKINAVSRKHKIVDGSGTVMHYAEVYYFVQDGTIYAITYTCSNGDGYDADFDFEEYLKDGFEIKATKTEE